MKIKELQAISEQYTDFSGIYFSQTHGTLVICIFYILYLVNMQKVPHHLSLIKENKCLDRPHYSQISITLLGNILLLLYEHFQ